MADYLTKDIRNIAFLGHGAEGKTTLTEAILYAAGHIDRIGKVEDGSTVTDYDPEEHKRGISISASVAPVEWRGTKVNILDCPGYFDFVGEALGALRVVETACIVVNGVSGMSVGAEKAWKMAVDNNVARMFIVNQMDRDHADFKKVLDDLRERYGNSVVPLIIPIGYGPDFKGVVNILENVAFEGSGKNLKEVPVPESLNDIIAQYNEEITEAAAENDDELIEKYFDQGFLTPDEIAQGFLQGMAAGTIVPVVAVSATQGIGIESLMRVIKKYLNSPENSKAVGVNPKTDEPVERACSNDEPFSAFVFKTISDPFVGKLSLFKVKSGSITPQTALYNSTKDKQEKSGGLFILRGKRQLSTQLLNAGDIGALSKLSTTATGDTLCDAASSISYPGIEYPEPGLSKAVFAAKQGEEDKVFTGLNRLMEEDPSMRLEKNAETSETILSGQGELHIDITTAKLLSKFGATAELRDPRIPYRETIRKTVSCQGRHKKQTGGHGQFGDVWIEFSPIGDTNIEFEFVDAVVGGAVPRNFIPAVEKGLRENIVKGVLAGYPMVGLRAKLYDGSSHSVDSSEMAFKTAARIAYRKGCKEASPVLLEPILRVEVLVPDEYMGDVMGDVSKRRGRIMGMNQVDGQQQVIAEVPMSEMAKYATDLRSMTQARGSFTTAFERYEEVPADVAQKVIESAEKDEDDED
ncbi:MAG TPA: elongation factor G [Clostridiales bacterium]|nr:elongation factor G [Clostridiales bacterium]